MCWLHLVIYSFFGVGHERACSISFLSSFQHYFIDAWNSFDALIVVGSVVDIVVTEFSVSPTFCIFYDTHGKLKP